MEHLEIIGFDADDTLWENESFFREAEEKFSELLKDYGKSDELIEKLYHTEIGNIDKYGYGIKSFTLSMIECALDITDGHMENSITGEILAIGQSMLKKPVKLIPGVEKTLKYLRKAGYPLIVATKGDLIDQERKLKLSGLGTYFHHIEVMSAKQPQNYLRMLQNLKVHPENFLMVGNSVRSDIQPLLDIGASAVHIPFSTTWKYEEVQNPGSSNGYQKLESITELPAYVLNSSGRIHNNLPS